MKYETACLSQYNRKMQGKSKEKKKEREEEGERERERERERGMNRICRNSFKKS